MPFFGNNFNEDDYDHINIFSHWLDNCYNLDEKKEDSKPTIEEILDGIDIKEIEKYLRKKKLEKIKENDKDIHS